MPPKQKKITLWNTCATCNINIPVKDLKIHSGNCQILGASFISRNVFNTTLHNINHNEKRDYLLLHHSVIQLCQFVIGDPVLVQCTGGKMPSIVRNVWPSSDANNYTTALTNIEDLPNEWQNLNELKVSISKFNNTLTLAETIHFTAELGNIDKNSLISFLKYSQSNKIVSSKLSHFNVRYFGKNITICLQRINDEECGKDVKEKWFVYGESTKWILQNSEESKDDMINVQKVAGVDNILNDIFSIISILFSDKSVSNLKILKSTLLYGHSGTGKTAIAKYVASKSNVNVININTSEIYSKFYGETEASLKKSFDRAIKNSPSIVLIDDVDVLCPKRTSSGTEQEKRITSTLATLLDSIHSTDIKVFVLCCCSKINTIEPSLRRFGRIDYEIEIPIPSQLTRNEILSSFLSHVKHDMTADEIKIISDAAHGYVGADLANLCTQASMHMFQDTKSPRNSLSLVDFEWALNHVSPSAMREVLIDVPDVKWSDVGGQEKLKLNLKQLVEWPLKYADDFARLGIKPPSGILMYGPPGCSKTMIAKAVACESHLNFLSIKGPELFSKWVGESERAVRELFRKARQVAPSIIFFDEIDALGSERSKSGNSSSNVQERILAQLLTEMDGITPLGNVTIIAATNRPDKIDSALLRPGRLDRIVYVPLPDESTRRSIFELRLSKMPICDSVEIDSLVSDTDGYSGAEIMALCHEAALIALEEDINIANVTNEHFNKAKDIVKPRTPEHLLQLYQEFSKSV